MYRVSSENWKLKDGWNPDFRKESCAYCYFDCDLEICFERDYFCDNFEPNDQLEFLLDI